MRIEVICRCGGRVHLTAKGLTDGARVQCRSCNAVLLGQSEARLAQINSVEGTRRRKSCPECGARVSSNDVICLECGLEFSTGQRLLGSEHSVVVPRPGSDSPALRAGRNLMLLEIRRTVPSKWLVSFGLLVFLLSIIVIGSSDSARGLSAQVFRVFVAVIGIGAPFAGFLAVQETCQFRPGSLREHRASVGRRIVTWFSYPRDSEELHLEDYQSVRVYDVDHWFSATGIVTAILFLITGIGILALSAVMPFFLVLFLFAPFFRAIPQGLMGAVHGTGSAVSLAGSLCNPIVIAEGPVSKDKAEFIARVLSAVTALRISGLNRECRP